MQTSIKSIRDSNFLTVLSVSCINTFNTFLFSVYQMYRTNNTVIQIRKTIQFFTGNPTMKHYYAIFTLNKQRRYF